LKCIFRFLECVLFAILVRCGLRRNVKYIPESPYCYLPDIGRNNNKSKDDWSYYIIPCKYYKYISQRLRGCTYLGYMGEDLLLSDQCKICGEKDGMEYDETIELSQYE